MSKPISKQDLLTPPNFTRCQADVPNGTNFMTLGGDIGGTVRCKMTPTVIVYEVVPGPDGLMGSMSLCPSCLAVFKARFAKSLDNYRIEEIK